LGDRDQEKEKSRWKFWVSVGFPRRKGKPQGGVNASSAEKKTRLPARVVGEKSEPVHGHAKEDNRLLRHRGNQHIGGKPVEAKKREKRN